MPAQVGHVAAAMADRPSHSETGSLPAVAGFLHESAQQVFQCVEFLVTVVAFGHRHARI